MQEDTTWQKLSAEQRLAILEQCGIESPDQVAKLDVGTREALLQTLSWQPLHVWNDRIEALAGRFTRARELAAKELEPKVHSVELPRRILKTDTEVEAWLREVRDELTNALAKGPVVIR